ncbi:Uncharacterized membrane protein YdjX, TVP38/TMEM64 family, SNARE-associated domain [Spirosomataceae bacterium TFI 002]|nr:Uncharacterized membrane protein YdjX, TVP38/TMEM64 family, SNARE-associated domain [Spirosomataceae bacterium TFI 002]
MQNKIKKLLSGPLIVSVLLMVVPLVATSFLTVYFVQHEDYFLAFSTIGWVSFTLLGIFTQALAITPPTFCGLVLGFFWGWKTLPLLFVINLLSILLIYFLVKRIDSNRFSNFINSNPKASKLLKSIRTDELKIITLTKLSPVLPFTLTNFIFALSGAKLKNILLGGFLGMIPRTVVAVWSGTKAKEIKQLLENPNEGAFQQILLIGLILLSAIGLFVVINKAIARVS